MALQRRLQVPRKPRGEGVLAKLSDDHKAELRQWLLSENLTYAEARSRLEERFQIKPSLPAIAYFFHRFCVPKEKPAPYVQKMIIEIRIVAPENFEVAQAPGGAIPS